jgi:hypothetical protein
MSSKVQIPVRYALSQHKTHVIRDAKMLKYIFRILHTELHEHSGLQHELTGTTDKHSGSAYSPDVFNNKTHNHMHL